VVDLSKPVLLVLQRGGMYTDWSIILGPDGNAKETKILCDFAMKNHVSGFIVDDLTPNCVCISKCGYKAIFIHTDNVLSYNLCLITYLLPNHQQRLRATILIDALLPPTKKYYFTFLIKIVP